LIWHIIFIIPSLKSNMRLSMRDNNAPYAVLSIIYPARERMDG